MADEGTSEDPVWSSGRVPYPRTTTIDRCQQSVHTHREYLYSLVSDKDRQFDGISISLYTYTSQLIWDHLSVNMGPPLS